MRSVFILSNQNSIRRNAAASKFSLHLFASFFLYFSPLRIDIIPHSFPFDPSDVDRSVSFYPTDCVRKSLPAFEPRKISFRIHKFRPRRTIRIYWWNLFPFWNPHLSPTWANIFYWRIYVGDVPVEPFCWKRRLPQLPPDIRPPFNFRAV